MCLEFLNVCKCVSGRGKDRYFNNLTSITQHANTRCLSYYTHIRFIITVDKVTGRLKWVYLSRNWVDDITLFFLDVTLPVIQCIFGHSNFLLRKVLNNNYGVHFFSCFIFWSFELNVLSIIWFLRSWIVWHMYSIFSARSSILLYMN